MGTSIDCFFGHQTNWVLADLQRRLDDLCTALSQELDQIRAAGRFSNHGRLWRIWQPEPSEDQELFGGEGPAGLGIWVYGRVICLTSSERFGALYDESYGLVAPLRRVLCSLAVSLSHPSAIAVAAAGFGDTDGANDVAANGGSFEDVCGELSTKAGPPANAWRDLKEASWYLGPPDPAG
jgi:hypothetical protein